MLKGTTSIPGYIPEQIQDLFKTSYNLGMTASQKAEQEYEQEEVHMSNNGEDSALTMIFIKTKCESKLTSCLALLKRSAGYLGSI